MFFPFRNAAAASSFPLHPVREGNSFQIFRAEGGDGAYGATTTTTTPRHISSAFLGRRESRIGFVLRLSSPSADRSIRKEGPRDRKGGRGILLLLLLLLLSLNQTASPPPPALRDKRRLRQKRKERGGKDARQSLPLPLPLSTDACVPPFYICRKGLFLVLSLLPQAVSSLSTYPSPSSPLTPPPPRHLLQTEILPSSLFFSVPQAVQTFRSSSYHHSFSPSDSLSSMSLPVSTGAFKGPSPFLRSVGLMAWLAVASFRGKRGRLQSCGGSHDLFRLLLLLLPSLKEFQTSLLPSFSSLPPFLPSFCPRVLNGNLSLSHGRDRR